MDDIPESETASVVIEHRSPSNPYRRPFLILVAAICVGLLAQAVSSWVIFDVAHDTNRIVTDVDFRNSPENQKAQAALLDQIILRVDCNSRETIQEALNDISETNPGLSFNVDIVEENCTTTTTLGSGDG